MASPEFSRTTFKLRMLALILGAGLLIWLPFEDTREEWVIGFAVAINAWFAARYLTGFSSGTGTRPLRTVLRHTLAGFLAGLAVSSLALFLMALKAGLHGHAAPEFTPNQIMSVLRRTPIFALSGMLLGLGSGLAALAGRHDTA